MLGNQWITVIGWQPQVTLLGMRAILKERGLKYCGATCSAGISNLCSKISPSAKFVLG